MIDLDKIEDENHHTVQLPFAILVFWNNGLAAGAGEPHTSVEVKVPGDSIPMHAFKHLRDGQCTALLYSLEKAFKLGEAARAKAISKLLEH
jgi:hypothetical protein